MTSIPSSRPWICRAISIPSWTVAPTPLYNGIWVVAVDTNGSLWIGGEFKKLGTGWVTSPCSDTHPVGTGNVTQQSVARFD